MQMLEIKDLHVEIDGKKILNGLDLTVEKGVVHAIMGPNGSGKSTLSYVLAGKEAYKVTQGHVLLDGEDLLEMALLEPRLCVLDETDSGLDIDALKVVAEGVNRLRSPDRSFVVITHYQRLLDYIVPDVVHVLSRGRIVRTGGKELAHELEARGYAQYQEEMALTGTTG